jgi:hypothetical protein
MRNRTCRGSSGPTVHFTSTTQSQAEATEIDFHPTLSPPSQPIPERPKAFLFLQSAWDVRTFYTVRTRPIYLHKCYILTVFFCLTGSIKLELNRVVDIEGGEIASLLWGKWGVCSSKRHVGYSTFVRSLSKSKL